jgi:beta-glucosidase
MADDGVRLWIDGKLLIDHFIPNAGEPTVVGFNFVAGEKHDLKLEYFQGIGEAYIHFNWIVPGKKAFQDAIDAASTADVAIVFAGTMGEEGEGTDRPSMDLPADQDELINDVASVNKHTIVVLNNGTPVTMTPWLSNVSGVVETFFPGQEGGNALAAILFGEVNPSGKLPITLGARRSDYPDAGNFPGVKDVVNYTEGIYVGYRHFDKANIAPVYPFGYGLSYTTFAYSNLKLSPTTFGPNDTVTVTADVTNTGSREGAEVAELYVHDPAPKIDRPVRELKGFSKVDLMPGQTAPVSFTLNGRSFAYCDVAGKQWKADAGDYDVEIGASSRDIKLQAPVHLDADYTLPVPDMGWAPPKPDLGLALGKPVTASSVEINPTQNLKAENAVDDDMETRWGSAFSDPQWIDVDLGQVARISAVKLWWETAYGSAYHIDVSLDDKTWTTVYGTDTGKGGTELDRFLPVRARYVRMYGIKRGTQYGYSLFGLGIYPAQ